MAPSGNCGNFPNIYFGAIKKEDLKSHPCFVGLEEDESSFNFLSSLFEKVEFLSLLAKDSAHKDGLSVKSARLGLANCPQHSWPWDIAHNGRISGRDSKRLIMEAKWGGGEEEGVEKVQPWINIFAFVVGVEKVEKNIKMLQKEILGLLVGQEKEEELSLLFSTLCALKNDIFGFSASKHPEKLKRLKRFYPDLLSASSLSEVKALAASPPPCYLEKQKGSKRKLQNPKKSKRKVRRGGGRTVMKIEEVEKVEEVEEEVEKVEAEMNLLTSAASGLLFTENVEKKGEMVKNEILADSEDLANYILFFYVFHPNRSLFRALYPEDATKDLQQLERSSLFSLIEKLKSTLKGKVEPRAPPLPPPCWTQKGDNTFSFLHSPPSSPSFRPSIKSLEGQMDVRLAWGLAQEETALLTVLDWVLRGVVKKGEKEEEETEDDKAVERKDEDNVMSVHTNGTSSSLPPSGSINPSGIELLECGMVTSPLDSRISASPDAILLLPDGSIEAVEVKTSCPIFGGRHPKKKFLFDLSGFPMEQMVSEWVVQVHLEMLSLGPRCQSALLLHLSGGEGGTIWRIPRDEDLIARIQEFVQTEKAEKNALKESKSTRSLVSFAAMKAEKAQIDECEVQRVSGERKVMFWDSWLQGSEKERKKMIKYWTEHAEKKKRTPGIEF